MRCSLSSSTRKRPSGSISSIWPSMTKSSSFATRSGLLEIHGRLFAAPIRLQFIAEALVALERRHAGPRSEEHTSELQSLMRISYAVFCLKKKKTTKECQYKQLKQTTKT